MASWEHSTSCWMYLGSKAQALRTWAMSVPGDQQRSREGSPQLGSAGTRYRGSSSPGVCPCLEAPRCARGDAGRGQVREWSGPPPPGLGPEGVVCLPMWKDVAVPTGVSHSSLGATLSSGSGDCVTEVRGWMRTHFLREVTVGRVSGGLGRPSSKC